MIRLVIRACAAATIALLVLSTKWLTSPTHASSTQQSRRDRPLPVLDTVSSAALDTAELIDLDVFGELVPSGHPATSPRSTTPVTTRPPLPVLTLRAIIWGKSPLAIIEGIPGVNGGRLFAVGDKEAGIRVVAIHQARVRVTAQDSSWTLSLVQQ